MNFKQGVFLLSLCLLTIFAACRRNQPSLVDTNEAPDTQLWYSPPDSTEYEYLVHMYWRGLDNDGTVEEFIWTIQDTLVIGEQVWNPAQRLADLRSGRRTTRTDSIFSFTAFKDVGGVGVKKNRQAFHIASIDDNGVIDPSPAALEFVATIDQLPRIRFSTHIGGVSKPYVNLPVPEDTVGMFKPFAISYNGVTTNGEIRGYRWAPLSTTIILPGAGIWTEDLSDTMRVFVNTGADTIPSSTFRFSAQCIDDADAESSVDAGQFRTGVCQVVVNFDPDTRLTEMWNSYTINDIVYNRQIDFTDGVADTVPYASWLTMRYQGWEQRDQTTGAFRDSVVCSPTNPDRCIDFQISYQRTSTRVPGSTARSGWLPRDIPLHDTDPGSATDSNTVNIGSLEYDLSVRSVDEKERPDGTPATARIIGNYDPTMDSYSVLDGKGNPIDVTTPGQVDTVKWDFFNPSNYNGSTLDTLEIDGTTLRVVKEWTFTIRSTGHDHPWDPDGSGVKSWRYFIYADYGTPQQRFWPLARAGETWVAGPSVNNLADKHTVRVTYEAGNVAEMNEAYNSLPQWMGKDITVFLRGRDTATNEPNFNQYVFLNGERELINAFPAASFGRYTRQSTFTFQVKMER